MHTRHALLSLFLAGSVALAGQSCTSPSTGTPVAPTDSVAAVPVEVGQVLVGSIDARYMGTATLEAWDEAAVASRASGLVVSIAVEEGDYVKEGQLLAKLDDDVLNIELAQTKSQLDKMNADFSRSNELIEKKLISQEQHDAVRYERDRLQAAYDLKVLQLDQTRIVSPISGVVSKRLIKTGNLVSTNLEVFQVTAMNRLRAIMHIPEHELGKMKVGQQVMVKADALPGMDFTGKVSLISPVIDPATGTVKVTIEVAPHRELKPGMFTRVQLVYDRKEQALLVPRNAVVTEDRDKYVYVVDGEKALRKPVVTGYVNEAQIEVVEGLEEGMMIVTLGQNGLKDSAKVHVIKPISSL